MTNVSTFRRHLVQVICAVLVCSIIITAWYPNRPDGKTPFDPKQPVATESVQERAEAKVYQLEMQFFYAVLPLLKDSAEKSPETAQQVRQIEETLKETVVTSLKYLDSGPKADDPITNLERKKFITALWIDAREARDLLCEQFVARHSLTKDPEVQYVDQVLLRSCDNFEEHQTAPEALSLEEYQLMHHHLGWFASVYQSMLVGPETKLAKDTFGEAKFAAWTFIKMLCLACSIGAVSLICGTLLFTRLVQRKVKRRFTKPEIDTAYILETFTWYLLAMFCVPLALRAAAQSGVTVNFLKVNLYAISSLTLLAFWPRLCGAKITAVERSFGLAPLPWRETFRNMIVGPFTYLAAILPLFVVILVYSALLQAVDVKTTDAAHPIIPLLGSTRDPATTYTIIFMAVIVAPFVEEIMFRGVLYSWLRSRFGAIASIIVSSLIFAAVHPQGPIGVLPLTFIGMVLAFVREWRGSLVAPMVAHACFNAGTLAIALNVLR